MNKHYYEDLIDNLMIEETGLKEKLGEEVLNKIINSDEKRLAILVALDPDNLAFRAIHERFSKKGAHKTKQIKEVVKMLREYVKVAPTEKKKFGEVMTPITLVEEMLDALPKEVWTNSKLKWLDPANGVGIFPAVIVERLMVGLEKEFPSPVKRYKHILENMIYVCELQAKNMFLHMIAFDPQDKLLLNIHHGSFLEEGFDKQMEEWGVDKFDIIVSNPPYQKSGKTGRKTEPLWDKFVTRFFDYLNEGGYLSCVHPSGWRDVGGRFKDVQGLLKSKQILYLETHNVKDGIKKFGVSIYYDWYCLRNTQNTNYVTTVLCQDGTIENIELGAMDFIPNGRLVDIMSLVAKQGEESVQMLHNWSSYETRKPFMSKEQTEEFKYPCVYTTAKDGTINLMWSSNNSRGHFGIPKVIFTNGGASTPCVDATGMYGLTQFAYGIVDDPVNLLKIKQALSDTRFLELISVADGNIGHRYSSKVMSTFRKDFWKEFV